MLLFTSSRDDVNGVIDESLLEGDDDVEFDAEKEVVTLSHAS